MVDLVCPLARPFERDPDLVELDDRLGVRVVQLTYNTRNWVGDGCEETDDAGLSAFGRRVIREMDRFNRGGRHAIS